MSFPHSLIVNKNENGKRKKSAHSFIGVSILSSQLEECFQLNSTKFKPKLYRYFTVAANCLLCTRLYTDLAQSYYLYIIGGPIFLLAFYLK